jgi:hypothetical protein
VITPISTGQPPGFEDLHIDRAAGKMGAPGADCGRNDDGERGADAQRHPHLQRHAGKPKAFIKHRHQDRAAADTEQAGKKSCQCTHRNQQQRQFEQLGNMKPRDRHPRFPLPHFACALPRVACARS